MYDNTLYPFYRIEFIEKYRHSGIKFIMKESSFILLNRDINLLNISV